MFTTLSFMTEEHHLIRYFVVRELPHIGKPIPPELISDELKMPLSMTINILDDLERNLFFLVRNDKVKSHGPFLSQLTKLRTNLPSAPAKG